MSNYNREDSVTTMLEMLGWQSLSQRRFVDRQTILWKALHDEIAVPIPPYIQQNRSQSRSAHSESFVNIGARTDSYKYSYFPRTVRCWNLLPANVVESNTAHQFKNALWRHIADGSILVTSPKDVQHRPRLGSTSCAQHPIVVY